MATRTFDADASSFTVRTRAKGLLARLAHDLEIEAKGFSGSIELDGDAWHGELRFPIGELRVVGSLRGDRVDRAVLSSSDKSEIDRKIREEVLPVPEVRVRLENGTRTRCDAVVISARGEQRVSTTLTTEDRRDGEVVCYGELALSLKALKIKEVKAPLGAFKVADRIEVAFWVMLVPASES
jgi:hypothetical protein